MRGGGEQGIDSVAAGTPELEDLARLFVTREFDVWRMWRDGLVERRNWVLKPSDYKENKKPWDNCQAYRFGQKAEIGQGLTVFILQG